MYHFAALWTAIAVRLRRKIWFPYGFPLYANVDLCIYGPTGDRKTTAMRRAVSLLYTRRVTLHLFSSGSQAETRKTSRCVEERFREEMMHNHPLHVLEQQKEAALAHEAETRRRDIVAEAEQLLIDQSAARAQFDETINTLLATARTLATLHEDHKKLICEDRYLRDRFALDARAEPAVFNFPPLPSNSSIELRITNKLTELFRVAGSWRNEWETKRQAWHARREQLRREAEAMQPRPVVPGRGPLLYQTFSRDKSDAKATSDLVAGDGATTSE